MMPLRWEDPPPHGNSKIERSIYDETAAALRARPGAWAAIAEGGQGTTGPLATRIRQGYGPFAPAGSFEACVRKSDGKSVTYARFVGESP